MGKTIVVSNQKGGCGKTNAAVNLGVGLARQGERVLLIDADAQNSLTISLGITESDKLPVTPKFLDAKGLEHLLKTIAKVRKNSTPALTLAVFF